MSKSKVSSFTPIEYETDVLLGGLSESEIKTLEKEFENLCDLDATSRGNSVSSEPGIDKNSNKSQDTRSLHEKHNPCSNDHETGALNSHCKNLSEEKPSIALDRLPSHEPAFEKGSYRSRLRNPSYGDRSTSSRAERRRQFYSKCSDGSPGRSDDGSSRFSHSVDESLKNDDVFTANNRPGRRFSASDDKEDKHRTTRDDVRRSRLNAPESSSTSEARTRLTRRRISREDDPDSTAALRSRLTSRRLNSVDSEESEPKPRMNRSFSDSHPTVITSNISSDVSVEDSDRPRSRLRDRLRNQNLPESKTSGNRKEEAKPGSERVKNITDSPGERRRLRATPDREVTSREERTKQASPSRAPAEERVRASAARESKTESTLTSRLRAERIAAKEKDLADRRKSPARTDSPRSTPDRQVKDITSRYSRPSSRTNLRSTPDREVEKNGSSRPARSRLEERASRSTPDREIASESRPLRSKLEDRNRATPDRELDKNSDSSRPLRSKLEDRRSPARATPNRELDKNSETRALRTRVDDHRSPAITLKTRLTAERDSRSARSRLGSDSTDSSEPRGDTTESRLRRHLDKKLADEKSKTESSDDDRQNLIQSMRKNLNELKDLRKTARDLQSKSDSSGDEKRVLRLKRTPTDKSADVVNAPRSKSDSGSEDGLKSKSGIRPPRNSRANFLDSESSRESSPLVKTVPNDIPKKTEENVAKVIEKSVEMEPRQESKPPQLLVRRSSLEKITLEPERRGSFSIEPNLIENVISEKSEDSGSSKSHTPEIQAPSVKATTDLLLKPGDSERESRETSPMISQLRKASLDTTDGRSDIVLPKRLPRTEFSKADNEPSIATNFCVDYAAQRRSSIPKADQSPELRRGSADVKPDRTKIRRSGSLRTVKDRSWIRDQSDDVTRNVEIPRRDSLRQEDQSWIRDENSRESTPGSTISRGSYTIDGERRDSFTAEEKVVLRRPSQDITVEKLQVTPTVDDEISEVRAREGNRAEDDKCRMSLADKLKMFSDSPQDKTPSRGANRRKQRHKAQRFKTQPITLEEVEKAGKITPRPVSLVVTDKDSRLLQKALDNRGSSSEKELHAGPLVEIPKEDKLDFFTTDAKPIQIQVDSDAFNDVFLSSEDLLDIRRKPKPKRRARTKHTNPIKALQERDDLQDAYTEVKVVDKKKIQRQQIDSKTGYAEAALQGLASVENFNKVSLKKATETRKSTDPYSSLMLVLIKGRRNVQCRLVEPKSSSLCSGDCYVLITEDKIFCWLGKYGNIIEKAKAQEFANLLFKHKGMGFKGEKDPLILEEHEFERKKEFWELLGGRGPYKSDDTDDELYEFRLCEMNIVYELRGDTLTPSDWCGQPLKYEMLSDHSKVIVFDFGTELYVWNGPKCSFEDRKNGMKLAKTVWDNGVQYNESPNPFEPFKEEGLGFKGPRPEWCIFGKINQNMETQLFKEKFADWPESGKIITVKQDKKEEKEVVELTPVDVSQMLKPNREPVTLVLEGTHVGRGRTWSEKKDDFVSKDFDIVTKKVQCWLVREYDHHVLDHASFGQFHDADTYVVRWQYMVIPAVKTLRGGASRQTLSGRERCSYFFWQGNASSINEKGASALMTVELDEERGPQVRVVQGQEPPCFTQLFDGKMMVHNGKRGTVGGPWKLYILRNEIEWEAYLLEVQCLYASLRSRSSFILLNTESGLLYVWHGAKSPQTTRQVLNKIAKDLSENFPPEIGMKVPLSDPVELNEGNERRNFFLAFKDVEANSVTLTKDLSFKKANAPDYKMSPRLFYLTAVSGVFEAIEILHASRSEHISPLPFTQEHLYDPCIQPALFILDIGTKVYVWQGWWPDGFDETEINVQTGSARARFSRDRKLTLETAHAYCHRKDIPGEIIVAGYESDKFTDLFPTWTILQEAETNNWEENEKLNGVQSIPELLKQYEKTTYTYLELIQKPEGLDLTKIESYLCDEEFEMVFKMSKDDYYNMPAWKQIAMRKSTALF